MTMPPLPPHNLTQNELKIIWAAQTNEFEDASDGYSPWVFSVIDASGLDPKVARGVIASLVTKGLVGISDYDGKGNPDDMIFSFTGKGHAYVSAYRLKVYQS